MMTSSNARADQLLEALCDAVETALLYGVFAEEAAREGDARMHEFYRGLQMEHAEQVERQKHALLHVLGDDDASLFTLEAP